MNSKHGFDENIPRSHLPFHTSSTAKAMPRAVPAAVAIHSNYLFCPPTAWRTRSSPTWIEYILSYRSSTVVSPLSLSTHKHPSFSSRTLLLTPIFLGWPSFIYHIQQPLSLHKFACLPPRFWIFLFAFFLPSQKMPLYRRMAYTLSHKKTMNEWIHSNSSHSFINFTHRCPTYIIITYTYIVSSKKTIAHFHFPFRRHFLRWTRAVSYTHLTLPTIYSV